MALCEVDLADSLPRVGLYGALDPRVLHTGAAFASARHSCPVLGAYYVRF